MTEKKEPDNLELEKIKLERLKVWGKIITVLISVGVGTFGVTVINNRLQEKQIDHQALVNEAKLQQSEMGNLGKFLDHALNKDINRRIRFADYFAKLTISDEARVRWEKYLEGLEKLQDDKEKSDKKVKEAQEAGESDSFLEDLIMENAKLEAQTASFFLDDEDVIAKRVEELKDVSKKPRNYTDNDFKFVTKNGDPVVIDRATGLMWQKSGSSKLKTYQEAEEYIVDINNNKFAGYNDWQLPSLKQVETLVEKEKNKYGLHIDDKFDKQVWIWTSKKESDSHAHAVSFKNGKSCHYPMTNRNNVRAVRLVQ